jgi:dolichol-phosphate mannosyltransferase
MTSAATRVAPLHPSLAAAGHRVARVWAGDEPLTVDADGLGAGGRHLRWDEAFPLDVEGDRTPRRIDGDDVPGALAAWATGSPVVSVGPGPAADLVRATGGGLMAEDEEHGETGCDLLRRLPALSMTLGHRGRRSLCLPPEAIAAELAGSDLAPQRGSHAGGEHVWVCLPTYNEAENISTVVPAVIAALDRAGVQGRVLVVDDGSPDGTGAIADRLAADSAGRVEVLHRPGKEGIGRAYLAGFERALQGGADLICEMDADWSHDPDDLPLLIDAVRHGADLALGSRYVSGGEVGEWGVVRRFISRGGSWYARTVLSLPVGDLTGGFKCFRADLLRRLPRDRVRCDGYGFQVELTYRSAQLGARIVEVPIHFAERRAGTSKMGGRIVAEAAIMVLALRRERRRSGR